MSVIAAYSLPADDSCLGRATGADQAVELERLSTVEGTLVGHVWVHGDRFDEFRHDLADQPEVSVVHRIDELADDRLFRAEFDPGEETLVSVLADHGVELLGVRGDDEEWSLRLGFEDPTHMTDFQTDCVDGAGLAIDLQRLYDPVEGPPAVRSELTEFQRETLVAAYEAGYFDIPREVTLVELADRLGVSDQAVSERMRRGEAKLVEAYLFEDADR